MPQYIPLETSSRGGWPLDEIEAHHLIHARRALFRSDVSECHDEFKSIVKTANLIGGHFRGVASFDLHSENMMKRSDGTMIITDPVSFTAYDYGKEKEESNSNSISFCVYKWRDAMRMRSAHQSWKMDDLRVYHLLNDLNKLPVRKLTERTAPHLRGCKKPKFLIDKQERMRFKRK